MTMLLSIGRCKCWKMSFADDRRHSNWLTYWPHWIYWQWHKWLVVGRLMNVLPSHFAYSPGLSASKRNLKQWNGYRNERQFVECVQQEWKTASKLNWLLCLVCCFVDAVSSRMIWSRPTLLANDTVNALIYMHDEWIEKPTSRTNVYIWYFMCTRFMWVTWISMQIAS